MNDKRTGLGTHTSPDGKQYVGHFKNDLRNGNGTVTYLNGDKYEGEWKDEKRHGQGAYIYPNGKKYEGEWKEGYKWNIEFKNKYGQTIRRWANGALQK